jgi:hypothetical protein
VLLLFLTDYGYTLVLFDGKNPRKNSGDSACLTYNLVPTVNDNSICLTINFRVVIIAPHARRKGDPMKDDPPEGG